jgi:two-component system OmpR family sensor kinase
MHLAQLPQDRPGRIEDRGPGVPEALRPALFERFARADEARSGGGLGLGLAIARAIAEPHGGGLELRPSERGAAFELTVPLQ